MINNLDKYRDIVTDMNACELWYEEIEEEYGDHWFKSKGLIIGVGNAGTNFLKRCIKDGFYADNPIMLFSCNEDEINDEDILASSFYKGDIICLEQHLILYKKQREDVPFVFIVCGFGGRSSSNIKLIAEDAHRIGLKVIVVGYYPFEYESSEIKERADSIIDALRCDATCEQLLVIDNSASLSFVDNTVLMPRLYSLIDEPIRGYLEYLSNKTRYVKGYENVEGMMKPDEDVIDLMDPDTGESKRFLALFEYENTKRGKKYLFFLEEEEKDRKGAMYVARYNYNDSERTLEKIDSEEEWADIHEFHNIIVEIAEKRHAEMEQIEHEK